MNTVYLIGNGFDVNLGLATKYSDFYNYYLGLERSCDSEKVSKLKEHMKKNLSLDSKYWSDLEEAMGIYTTELNSYSDLEEVYDNLNDEMQKYIESVEKRNLPSGINAELLKQNLSKPQAFLTLAEQEIINGIYNSMNKETHRISIVDFNYTTTIEKILKFTGETMDLAQATYHSGYLTKLENVYHIHGKSEQPILGVNDASQIINEKLRTNVDVQEYLIKPQINSTLGNLIDRKAKQAIKNASLICIYGLSLGSSDSIWWNLVGERLLNGKTVILYVYDNNARNLTPRKLGRYKRGWKIKLCDAARIQNVHRDTAMSRIIIAPNTAIFDIKKELSPIPTMQNKS